MAYFSLDATGDGPTWHCIQTSDLSVNRQNSISWGEAGIILQKTEMLKNIESVLGQFFGSGIVNFCQNWYFQAVLENILSLKDKWLLLLFFFFTSPRKGEERNAFFQLMFSCECCAGEADEELFHAPVPVRRLLCLRQAQGAGDSQHHLDRWVRSTASPSQNRQLHSCLLEEASASGIYICFKSTLTHHQIQWTYDPLPTCGSKDT